MTVARVRLNRQFVRRLGSWEPIDRDMERRAHRVAAMARGRGPIDTGRYVSSIEVRPLRTRPGAWRVIATDRKAGWIEWGTDPHEIRPRRRRALWWPGLEHPVGRVWHPGTQATHNMAEALELASRGVTRIR